MTTRETELLTAQVAALELEVVRLREALETFIAEHEECEDGDGWMAQTCSMEALHAADEAMSTLTSTEALDKYVAEKVKDIQLQDIEQYRLQMAGISTAAIGYWKEDDSIHPDYDTPALRDVAKLYANYESRTRQRDLAVDVLKTAYEVATNHDDRLPFDLAVYCEMLWQAIKESEAK